MSESKHTPGPWTACHEGKCSCGQVWSKTADHPVATVTRGEWGDPGCPYGEVSRECANANARLIAAAPELLEALQGLVSVLNPEILGSPNSPLEIARAVIAKATAT